MRTSSSCRLHRVSFYLCLFKPFHLQQGSDKSSVASNERQEQQPLPRTRLLPHGHMLAATPGARCPPGVATGGGSRWGSAAPRMARFACGQRWVVVRSWRTGTWRAESELVVEEGTDRLPKGFAASHGQ
jgi:hypothetical protein